MEGRGDAASGVARLPSAFFDINAHTERALSFFTAVPPCSRAHRPPPRPSLANLASIVFSTRSFGVAQWPSRKDEDRACVTGAVPGLFDAVAQLYDGHGGKLAARHCVAHLVPRVTEAFFKQKACRAYRHDVASLAKATATGGFHPAFDTAVITAFEQLDEEIKRLDPSGTTAAVLFFKKSDDGDVHVKCAWVGDSRVVLTRDFDPSRTMDLSDDHKPGSASEVARIREHYEALHGGAVFKSRDEVLEHFEASVRGGKVDGGKGKKPLPPGFGKIGNHSNGSSPGGSSRGNSRPQSRGNSQRGGTPNSRGGSRNGPNLAARDGLPAVEMTLGHSEAMEEAVWGALEGPGEGGDPGAVEVVVTTRAQRDARGAVTEAFEASVSIDDLTELREIASRSPGAGEGSAARGDSADGASSVPTEIVDGTSVAFTSVEMRRSVDDAIVASFGEEEKFASALNQLPPSREPSDKKLPELTERVSGTTSGATTSGSPIQKNAEAADLVDESEDAVGSLDGDSEPAFRRVDLARMSFVGYYKDDQGKALSKPRIYSSSGESHGVSRSIGDRGSARACVATPEIRTVVVPFGSGARFMACSDGVWDAFSSDKATRRVSRFVSPQGAAKRMCVYARERTEYRGMHADDITAVVVDIGENARGGDPQCACVVS